MSSPIKIRCAATGRVLLVRPIDAQEWLASGAGSRVPADEAGDPSQNGRAKRQPKRKSKQASLPAEDDTEQQSTTAED